MRGLLPFVPVQTRTLPLNFVDVKADAVIKGSPRTGDHPLGAIGSVALGVWEHTSGGMRDVEVDEIFIVLEGAATVTLLTEDASSSVIQLEPGVICRLAAGSVTHWVVPERLRKVYLIPTGEPSPAENTA